MPVEVTRIEVECLVRLLAIARMPRPLLVGMGLLAAATVAALVYVGADLRGGFAAGQSGLLPTFLQALYSEDAGLPISRSRNGGAA
jgi:hypothetical protein